MDIAGQAGLITSPHYSHQDGMSSNCVNELVNLCRVPDFKYQILCCE